MSSDSARGLTRAGEYRATKGASFLQATAVKRRSQEPVYDAVVPADWCFGPVAHGGYLASLLSRTIAEHIQHLSVSTSRSLPSILSSCNTTYLMPVLPGSVEIRIQDRSLSKASAYFIASLYQADPESKSNEVGAQSNMSLRTESTLQMTSKIDVGRATLSRSMNPRKRVLASDLYPRKADGYHLPQKDSGMAFYKYKPGWECYFRAESADRVKMLNSHPEYGPAVFDVWWKFDHDITTHELGFLADLIGPVLFNYEDVRRTHWLSTRQMSVDIVRAPPETQSGWKWVFCRMELIENAGNKFYCDVTMADEDGNVIGLARQSCVVRPFELVGKSKVIKDEPNLQMSKI